MFWYLFDTCIVDHPRLVARLATADKVTYEHVKSYAKKARRREYQLYQVLQDVAAATNDRAICISIDEPTKRIVVQFGVKVSMPWDQELITSIMKRMLCYRKGAYTFCNDRTIDVSIEAPFVGSPPPSRSFTSSGARRADRKVTVTFTHTAEAKINETGFHV